MKLMISYKGINKLMLNGTSHDEIVKFVHENFFLKMSKWTMYYIDSDDDAISLDSELDVATMFETVEKEQIKLFIKDVNDESKLVGQEINLEDSQQIKKNQTVTEQKNDTVKIQEKTQKSNENQKLLIQDVKKEIKVQINADIKQQNIEHEWKPHCHGRGMWKQKMQQKMAKFVDQRIQSLIPLITKKVQDKLQKKQEEIPKPLNTNAVNHKVKCNLCGLDQITGIRYKCTKCPLFNLCQVCQNKTGHNHNLIKMKYLQEQGKQKLPSPWWQKNQDKQIPPFQYPFQMPLYHHPPGLLPPQPFPKPPSQPFGGFLIPNKKDDSRQKSQDSRLKITKKCFKMSQLFGGEPNSYQQFVTKNQDLKLDDLSELYILMNQGTQISEQFILKGTEKTKKLSFYFGKPQKQFQQLVKKNPASNLKQLIKNYKEGKLINKKQANLESKQVQKSEKSEKKVQQPVPEKKKIEQKTLPTIPPPPPLAQVKNSQKFNIQKRNQCILMLKDLFGQNDIFEYIQFYKTHSGEKNETIIEKYIEKISKK